MHRYNTEQWLPITPDDAWKFFSTPKNLSLITPPELDFKIKTKLKGEEIYSGMTIDYTVKPIMGIPVQWKTEITRVLKPNLFTDRQVQGPYKIWEHTHTFEKSNGGVLMRDEIVYLLPLGIIGRIIHSLSVRKKIADIFSYRKKILNNIFCSNDNN